MRLPLPPYSFRTATHGDRSPRSLALPRTALRLPRPPHTCTCAHDCALLDVLDSLAQSALCLCLVPVQLVPAHARPSDLTRVCCLVLFVTPVPPLAPLLPALQDSWTPLHVASDKGHLDVVRELLAAGANVDAADNVRAE